MSETEDKIADVTLCALKLQSAKLWIEFHTPSNFALYRVINPDWIDTYKLRGGVHGVRLCGTYVPEYIGQQRTNSGYAPLPAVSDFVIDQMFTYALVEYRTVLKHMYNFGIVGMLGKELKDVTSPYRHEFFWKSV